LPDPVVPTNADAGPSRSRGQPIRWAVPDLDTHTRDLLRKGQSVEKLALVQAW